MRSVRLSLAGQRGSSLFKFGISGLWLTVFLLSTIHSNYAQAGPGTNGGAFSFAVNKFAFSEKDGNGVIVVTRDSEVGMVMIDVVAKNGTATNGIDFTFGPNTNSPATNTITFSNLQTSVSISVPIKAASVITNPHPALTATLSLANPRPALGENPAIIGTVGTRNPTAQLQIFDVKRTNEFNLDKSYYTTTEPGPGGVTTFQVNVTLPQAPTDKSSGVSVDYQVFTDRSFTTKPGSDYATEGEDYLADSGTLNFGPNDTSLPITITVTNDTLLEFNEDFHVKLSNAQGTLTMDVPPPSGGTTGSTTGTTTGSTAGTTTGSTTGTTTGSTGGTTGSTDTGSTGPTTVDIPYKLGQVIEANVTILFNGDKSQAHPAGSVDLGFNADNQLTTIPPFNHLPGANDTVSGLAHDSRTNIILVGNFTAVDAFPLNGIARLTPDGQVDQTFNPIGGANDFVSALAVYTNGTRTGQVVVVGGFTAINGLQRNGIARLNNDGSVDTSFNPGTGANGPVYAVALQRDGMILVGGDFTAFNGIPRNRIVRLTASGQVDLTFDPQDGADGPVYSIYAQSTAPIVLTAGMTNGVVGTFTRDVNVGATNGFLTLSYNFYSVSNDIAVLAGNTVLYYSGLTNNEIITTNIDGSLATNNPPIVISTEFIAPGQQLRFIVNTGGSNESTNFTFTATIQPFVALGALIGGDFTHFNGVEHGRIAKLNQNGSADLQFNSGTGLGADGTVYAIAVQTNRVFIGGAFNSFNSFKSKGLAALNADGSFDRTFSIATGAEDGDVLSIQVLGDGKILIGGSFTYFNETRRIFLARLLPNGPLDTSFLDPAYNQYAGFPSQGGVWPVGSVNAVDLDQNGDVLVGGQFSQVGGGLSRTEIHPRNNIARLHGGATRAPGNLGFVQNVFGADESGGALSVVLERVNGDLGSGAVLLSTLDGAAQAGLDYKGLTNTAIAWPSKGPQQADGATVNVVNSIPVINDNLIEGDENFFIDLTTPRSTFLLGGEYISTGFALGDVSTGQGLIIDDDKPPASFSFSQAQYDVNENDTTATINVIRSGGTSSRVSVRYTTLVNTNAGYATPNVDYIPASGILTFAPAQTNASFTVAIQNDTIVEQDELVPLSLSIASPGTVLGTNATANLNIIDNDYLAGRINFSTTNYTVIEGGEAVLEVRRTGGNQGVLSVNYATVDGTASARSDYLQTSGRLQWNDGDTTTRTITVPINDDGLVNGSRQFSVVLSGASPSDALGIRTNVVVTIQDNDSPGTFAFNAAEYLADENGTNAVINVVRRGGSAEVATVDYATTNLTAKAGTDYQAVKGTLTFGVGETSKSFVVPIIDNSVVDPERKIGLVLSNAQPSGASLGVLSNASITIIDNESQNIPAGSVDTLFGTGAGANEAVQVVALQADGRIMIGGDFTQVNRQVRTHLARLNSDSSLDTTFGINYDINDSVRDIAVLTNGAVVIAGSFTEINSFPTHYLARISAGGGLDNTFNVGAGADNPIFAVKETSVNGQRKYLIGGSFSVFNGKARRGIARVNEGGDNDLTFDPGSGVNGTVYVILLQRDGTILIGGEFTSVNGVPRLNIARLNADGSLDPTFDAGFGADGSVRALAVQFDDKILVGGLFTSVSGVGRQHVARLNPDGTLDTSFDPGLGADGAVYSIALQLDGQILVGGDFTSFNGTPENRITRLNPDGSIDPSINFGTGANAFIGSLVVQPDRRILAGGGFTVFSDLPRNRLARIYGGSLKGAGAIEFAAANFTAFENATNVTVTVRRTGGLLGQATVDYFTRGNTATPGADYTDVSGTLVFGPNQNSQTFTIPLINDNLAEPNELVDLVLTNVTGGAVLGNQPVGTLTIVSDDSVISFSDLNYTVNEAAPGGSAVITIKREGDATFPVTARFSTSDGTANSGSDYIAVSTNVIFAAGVDTAVVLIPIIDDSIVEDNETVNLRLSNPSSNAQLGRPNATLSILDNDFAPGIFSVPVVPPVSESAGSVIVTVARNSGKTGAVSVRYRTVDGTATAGQDYVAQSGTLSFLEGEQTKFFPVPILDDTKVEGNEFFTVQLSNPTGGATIGTTNTQVLILDDDFGPGSLDTTFNTSGGAAGTVNQIKLQPDGKLLVGGNFTSFGGNFAQNVVRLSSDGSVDSSFSASGPDAPVFSLADGLAGTIGLGGDFTNIGGVPAHFVGRLLTNGIEDGNFANVAGVNGRVNAMAAQPDGKLVLGGAFTTPANHIARITLDGSLDVSFNPDGGTDGTVNDIALQSDGRILIGGSFTTVEGIASRGIARLTSDGLIDASFQTGSGAGGGSSSGGNGVVNAIFITPEGKILIAGDFTSYNGVARTRVARLNADGTLDATFNPTAGPNGTVNDVMVFQGKIYVGGNFTSVGTAPRKNIARFNTDGSLDTAFDPGIGPDAQVRSITAQSNGQILIGGDFTNVNGFTSQGVARLNSETFTPISEIRITNVHAANGFIVLTFTSDIGSTYFVEGSADLHNWQTAQTIIATAATTDFNAPVNGPYRFYRIRHNP